MDTLSLAWDSYGGYEEPETMHIGRKLLAERVLGVGVGVFVLAFFMYVLGDYGLHAEAFMASRYPHLDV